MRDIPVFTTENGVASLILKQIPYWVNAYVRLQDTRNPAALLKECVDFCRIAGAENVYAAGHPALDTYPLHCRILRMVCCRESIADTDAALMPVLSENMEYWRKIYNEKMRTVANAAYMTVSDMQQVMDRGEAYYIHREDALLGIGIVGDGKLQSVISVVPGSGADVVKALCHSIFTDTVELEVASTNIRALNLYNRLGFVTTGEVSAWYKVL